MAEQVDDIQRIEPAIVFDLAWPHHIHLVEIVAARRISEMRVLDPLGAVSCFFFYETLHVSVPG